MFGKTNHFGQPNNQLPNQTYPLMSNQTISVALIGAGPSGLLLSAILNRTGIDYVHLEGGQIGQTLLHHHRRGHLAAAREALRIDCELTSLESERSSTLAGIRSFVRRNQLDIRTFERVTHLARRGTEFHLRSRSVDEQINVYRAKQVVLATGNCGNCREPAFVGCRSPRVETHLDHPHQYFRQRLLIIGDTIDALIAAEECAKAHAHVLLSHPDTLDKPLRRRIRAAADRGIFEYLPNSELIELDQQLAHLRQPDGNIVPREVDRVLLQTGYRPDYQLLHQVGVGLQGPGMVPAHDPETLQTSIPELFVLGSMTVGLQAVPSGRTYTDQVKRLARFLFKAHQLEVPNEMMPRPIIMGRRRRAAQLSATNEGLGVRF